ncbi:hypothetical protein JXA48_05315 [Candidatus Woesearchaeota archaeon]|nr:hypothetical protein [Candidatus Woesearchaeota archaeon]
MSRRHKRSHRSTLRKNNKINYIKKFIFWFIVYSILIILLILIFEGTKIFQAKAGFYLITGFILVIASRIIYSATKRKRFSLNGVIVWGLLYSLAYWLVDFVLNKLPKVQTNTNYDKYLNILIFAAIFTIIIMFLRRMKIGSLKLGRKRFKEPSQIFTGIILIVAGILSWRFSYQVFVGWFNWMEGMAWSWLIGLALIVAGALTLIAWWRNNVALFGTWHTVNWRRR